MVEESEKIDCEIPCEYCEKPIKFEEYDSHTKSCPKNPDLINQDKVGIPCELCQQEIPFEDYNKHFESHYQSQPQRQPGGFQGDPRFPTQQQGYPGEYQGYPGQQTFSITAAARVFFHAYVSTESNSRVPRAI